jgi:hypothetical protein
MPRLSSKIWKRRLIVKPSNPQAWDPPIQRGNLIMKDNEQEHASTEIHWRRVIFSNFKGSPSACFKKTSRKRDSCIPYAPNISLDGEFAAEIDADQPSDAL